MARKYARGAEAWGECGRCAARFLLRELVFDGQYPNMRVCTSCFEPKHPQENLKRIDDPVALWRPAPENLSPPSAPVLSGTLQDISTIELTWSESISDVSQVDTYRIYRSVDGGPFDLLDTYDVVRDMFGGRTSELLYEDATIDFTLHVYAYYIVARAVQGGEARSNVADLSDIHAVDVQVFDADGTWIKPDDAIAVEVIVLGAGGGGGGGQAATFAGPDQGGAGGGGGGRSSFFFVGSSLPDTVAVTVDQGGVGALPTPGGSVTQGSPGSAGGSTAFGPYLSAGGGSGGIGGNSGGGTPAVGGEGLVSAGGTGGIGGSTSSAGTSPVESAYGGAGGGGGGGGGGHGANAGGTTFTYAPGPFTGGAAGAPGAGGSPGLQASTALPGTGGGGGGLNAGAGGAGIASSGGGGGGGRNNTGNGGAGGRGGAGQVIVITHI